MATNAAAIAVVSVATLRQRRTWLDKTWVDNRMTLALSMAAPGAAVSGAAGGGRGSGASGSTSGACGPESPAADLIRSQTSGRGSTEPTIWFRTPSRYSHAWTNAKKALSTDI